MSSPKALARRMTFEDYLAFEERSPRRHEFVDGLVYVMTGGTRAHHRAGFNVAKSFDTAARGSRCEVFFNDFKLLTPRGNVYYPDVVVACTRPIDNDALFLSDPCVVVEVLSPSTARTDRGEKLLAYQEIASLSAYWTIEAKWRGVQRHWRDADGIWQTEEIVGDGEIAVPCLDTTLTLDAIYEDVDVPREPPRLRRVHERRPASYTG